MTITQHLDDCFEFGLVERLSEFDEIMDSIMQTDVPRHQVRDAINAWRRSVADAQEEAVEELTRVPDVFDSSYEAEIFFGTEV